MADQAGSGPFIASPTSESNHPLTTTFTRPSDCGIAHITYVFQHSSDIPTTLAILDNPSSCLPSNYPTATDGFYSPGIVCPEGYRTACTDTDSLSSNSRTIAICCPTTTALVEADDDDATTTTTTIELSCARNPKTMPSGQPPLYCTWRGPRDPLVITVVGTDMESGTTSRGGQLVSRDDGLDAYGVRMVYGPEDGVVLPTSTTTTTGSAGGGNGPSSVPADGGGQGSGGLEAAMIAVICVSTVLGLVLLVGLWFFIRHWRRRRQKRVLQRQQEQDKGQDSSAADACLLDMVLTAFGFRFHFMLP
ncbi:hypothetical protein VTJ04DRAFT_6229 [Mycothermus thermophilus]|uniref:uncharacterized protein n=1 Tax=Humicola insolens TaxID=85995 RepID=UPI003743A771